MANTAYCRTNTSKYETRVIIEHFGHSHSLKLLARCQKKSNALIISTPKDIGYQEGVYGNEYETQRSHWTRQLLKQTLGKQSFFIANPHSYLVLHGDIDLINPIQKRIWKSWKVSTLKKRIYPLYQLLFRFKP